jgi:hypothetical protein
MHIPCIPMLRLGVQEQVQSAKGKALDSPSSAAKGFLQSTIRTTLAVSGYGAKLPWKEMIGGPRSADRHLAIF